MSKNYQNVNNLKISDELLSFVNKELLKDLDISSEKFWEGFDNAVHDLAPRNKELIQIRENLQKKMVLFLYLMSVPLVLEKLLVVFINFIK